ncbi:MAG TPA: serine hydrolase [Longimicrobiaceae bacterium]|nr:serine hydrolase [Longimicrobiaceae bacterium]
MRNRHPRTLFALLALSAVFTAACAAAPAPVSLPGPSVTRAAASDTAALRRTLEQLTTDYRGVAGISVQNLATGEALSLRGDETFPSASLVKVPILVALLDEVHAGRMRLDEPIGLIERDKVGGSGVLRYLSAGLPITLGDAAWLMTIISDNTATNLLLDKVDIRTVWTKMESLGLAHTKVHSKTFRRNTSVAMDSSAKYGLGVAVPDEMVRLFALLHEGRAVSPAMDSLALTILKANQDGGKMVRYLPGDVAVAHKSGDVDRARNDCGIIYGPAAPVALCVMTRENEATTYAVDNPAHQLIGRVARAVFAHYNPGVALPPL